MQKFLLRKASKNETKEEQIILSRMCVKKGSEQVPSQRVPKK